MAPGHHRVLKMLREEHKREQEKKLAEKHLDMFRILEMITMARTNSSELAPSVIEDVISFCSLFKPLGFIPEEVTPAEYYALAYMLYELVISVYSQGMIGYGLKKTAVTALVNHVRWAEKEFNKRV